MEPKNLRTSRSSKVIDKNEVKKDLELKRDRDRQLVKGVFKDFECPGGKLEFSHRVYKGDPIETYTMYDGQIYTVPLGVAKHLNSNCWYGVHAFTTDEQGNKVQSIGQKVRRFGFQSLEFMDTEDFGMQSANSIIQVQTV